jgi:AAA15 family ATPase/GTPase
MLLRFSVANHLSIKETQELSLVASSLKDVEEGLITCAAAPGGRLLPAVVIYGANASGKSNVIDALRFMCQAILFSHRRGEPGGGVDRTPFALDSASSNVNTLLTTDFVVEGIRYHYGFAASDEAFTSEWLHTFPGGRRQTLFERDGQSFRFGRSLKGRNRTIASLTRSNSLFISSAAQNDHMQLLKIFEFFHTIEGDIEISTPSEIIATRIGRDEVDRRVINFLHAIGTGVIDYQVVERAVSVEVQAIKESISAAIEKHIGRPLRTESKADDSRSTIELAHRGSDGRPIFFNLDMESAGTRRLLVVLGKAFRALDRGTVLVIDELDASLHTQACEAALALFSSRATNPRGAQLIATTHDTNLLRSSLLRRDQVWFTEKDAEGATHLYPLTDIRTRKGDNIEKGYLQGRYGAIPFAGRISDLISAA